jgi:outer membrane immunogenic protein
MVLLLFTPVSARGQTPNGTGFLIGGHAGLSRHSIEYVEPDDPDAAIDPDISGFLGGGIAGYVCQTPRFILGVEFDAGAGSLSLESDDSESNEYSAIDLGWNGHVRGRIGVGQRTVPFVAAGVALARVALDDTDEDFGEDDAMHVGWTVGGGVDHALTDRLTVRAEYLYDDYGEQSFTITSPPGPFFPSYDANIRVKAHTIRATAIYRF